MTDNRMPRILRDGLIARGSDYYDPNAVIEQLGVVAKVAVSLGRLFVVGIPGTPSSSSTDR